MRSSQSALPLPQGDPKYKLRFRSEDCVQLTAGSACSDLQHLRYPPHDLKNCNKIRILRKPSRHQQHSTALECQACRGARVTALSAMWLLVRSRHETRSNGQADKLVKRRHLAGTCSWYGKWAHSRVLSSRLFGDQLQDRRTSCFEAGVRRSRVTSSCTRLPTKLPTQRTLSRKRGANYLFIE